MPYKYVTVSEAQAYFDYRLHTQAWDDSSALDKEKSLVQATQIIDRLNFKGCKKPVYDLLTSNPSACQAEINAANATQVLEFPRDTDTDILNDVKVACYEIAYALLDGIDPDLELENLDVISQGYASVRTTYSRSHNPLEHLSAGVPSATAWRYLKPLLRDPGGIKLSRV